MTDEFDYPRYTVCLSCGGAGTIDVGDCEDGVWDTCPDCEGYGEVKAS